MKFKSKYAAFPLIFKGEDPPQTEPNNHAMKQMRDQIDALNNDLKTVKEENKGLKDQLTAKEREKRDELDRIKAEKIDLETALTEANGKVASIEGLQQSVNTYTEFLTKEFDNRINSAPEEVREKLRTLSFIEGNPIESLNKLGASFELLGDVIGEKIGTVTNPSGTGGVGNPNPDKKLDLKTLTWDKALRPVSEILAGK